MQRKCFKGRRIQGEGVERLFASRVLLHFSMPSLVHPFLRVSDLTTEIVPTSESNRTGSSGAAGAAGAAGKAGESKADVPPPPAGGAPPLVSTASGWLKGGSGGPAAEKALERDELERKWFTLQRYAGARPSIPLEFALSTLLSTRGIDDLLRANPYMKDPLLVHRLLVSLQLHTCRVAQCNRSIGGAKKDRIIDYTTLPPGAGAPAPASTAITAAGQRPLLGGKSRGGQSY